VKDDLERILTLFSGRITHHRAKAIKDVLEVSTGEVWFGPDALSRGLVDGLLTSEEYVQRRMAEGAELFHVKKIDPDHSRWWRNSSGSSIDLPWGEWSGRSSPYFKSDALPHLLHEPIGHGVSPESLVEMIENSASRISAEQRAALLSALLKQK